MKIQKALIKIALERPKYVIAVFAAFTLTLVVLAGLPTVRPGIFEFLPALKIDTNPENMLPKTSPVRVFHNRMKEKMSLHDMIVVGVVNDQHPAGVFNPASLRKIHQLTEFAKDLQWQDPLTGETEGVVVQDMIAPSMVDNIEQSGPGEIRFEWLMRSPPESQPAAEAVRDKALNIPFLHGTMVSEDGKALALYLPITKKDVSSRIYESLNRKIAELQGPEKFHITGLPVAEDVFGVQMFRQMAISAPLAMLIIFLLLWFFFKRVMMAVPPIIDSLIAALSTMGLLVVTGNTVHIMSSMIPIFIVPIAVLDDVHVLSEFFDRYGEIRDRTKTLKKVMNELFVPMLYTTLTTAVGFGSLALAPIPPVQVFGLFVAFGVIVAWLCSILMVPSLIMLLPDRILENYGSRRGDANEIHSLLSRILRWVGRFTYRRAVFVISFFILITGISIYGMTLIRINDNPIKWFIRSHPIRIADRVLNSHFGGTYMAYLALGPQGESISAVSGVEDNSRPPDNLHNASGSRSSRSADKSEAGPPLPGGLDGNTGSEPDLPPGIGGKKSELGKTDGPSLPAGLSDKTASESEPSRADPTAADKTPAIFKNPEVLRYIASLENFIESNLSEDVGKTNSLADIVKTVHRELMAGVRQNGRKLTPEAAYRIPDTRGGVAQTLIQFQNSHRPQDLWHFTTPDYRTGNIWFQLTSGDNRNMSRVAREVNRYIAENPPPQDLKTRWFGLTYINVVWQHKMVAGMLKAFLGSFLAVFLMMTLLYRSALWGALCMVPLTLTIAIIYGMIGLIGKEYDMPVAVLSALSLGLAVDYAIHFLTRSRKMYQEYGSWQKTSGPVFGEPALAITRNAIVVALGFLPLVLAPLTPYRTVGIFIAAILAVAGAVTLFILPAMITFMEKKLFPRTAACCLSCKRSTCLVGILALVALVAVNIRAFVETGWTRLTLISLPVIMVLAVVCYLVSGREKCLTEKFVEQ